MLPGAGKISYLDIQQLKSISPDKYHVLILPHDESIPLELFDAMEEYVRQGGIVIFSQGVPLYYTTSKSADGTWKNSNTDDKYRNRLHIGWQAWWTKNGVPEESRNVYVAETFSSELKLSEHLPPVGPVSNRFRI